MKANYKRALILSIIFLFTFCVWTILIMKVGVKAVGVNGTSIGFATLNSLFHSLTGVHMGLYVITDWLGLVPIFICFGFGILGLVQLSKRKSLFKVDLDIIFLGIYYIIVIACYVIFEMIPINYRPILINGFLEASYPSSTTLLVLSVMPTAVFQAKRRLTNIFALRLITIITKTFSAFMVIGRLISGVHWITDIIGSVLLSAGLYFAYEFIVLKTDRGIKNGI